MQMKKFILEIIVIAAAAVGIGLLVNAFSPRGIAWIGQWDAKAGAVTAKAKSDTVVAGREIELPEAETLYKQGVLFVDARSADDYKTGHIRGAVSMSVEDYWTLIASFHAAHPDVTAPIVAYCSGRECSDSHDLAENLMQSGYSNVKIFIDGYPAWEGKGLPVEKQP